ncbi:unnamed protein product, partial [Brassica oleracea]
IASSTISSCGIEKIRKECYYERMSLQPNKRIVDLIEVIMFQRSNADDNHTRKLVAVGCRPSSFIRVPYTPLCGSHADTSFLSISSTWMKTSKMDKMVMVPLAILLRCSLRESMDVADMPMVIKVFSKDLVEAGEAVEEALDKNEEGMTVLMAEADKLRLDTIRTIVEVLTPVQVAALLLSLKRLHVSLHEWGRGREECCLVCAAARGGAGKSKRSATC